MNLYHKDELKYTAEHAQDEVRIKVMYESDKVLNQTFTLTQDQYEAFKRRGNLKEVKS